MAESGEVEELGPVFLRGAYVNARNKYGMTALMKAAYHGHTRMVRALLQRGADPNLARNDRFTALALAAFFGHTDIVRILVEHGAKPNVVTRCGASAQTWAIRRTFVEAARCLEAQVPAPAPAPVPVRPSEPTQPLVVKTLKDPPEIWDLVHEAPRSFNARSAFVSRLHSMKTSFALRVAAAVVVSAGCVIGVLMLRESEAGSLPVETPQQQTVVASEVSAPANAETTKSETPAEPTTPEVNELSHHSEPANEVDKPARKVVLTRQTRARAAPAEPVQVVQSREAPVAAPVVTTPKVEPRNSPAKPNTSLSPQLIAPAKSAPPKGKVIQWP